MYEAVTYTHGPNHLGNYGKTSGLVRLHDSVLLEMKTEDVSRAVAYPLDLVHFAAPSIYKAIEADTPDADPRKLGQLFDWAMWDHWRSRFQRLGVRDPYRSQSFFEDYDDDESRLPFLPPRPRQPPPRRAPRKLSKASKAPSVMTVPEPEDENAPLPSVIPCSQRYAFTGDVRQTVRKFKVWFLYDPMPFVQGKNGEKGRYMFRER